MKEKFFLSFLLLALILSSIPVWAQEEDGEANVRVEKDEAKPDSGVSAKPAQSTGKPALPSLPGANTARAWLNVILGYVAQIGAIFGKATGMRIGGTSASAILMLVIAKAIENKAPSWVRYLLYAGGGTMIAGSGANIAELAMGLLK